MCKKGEEEGIQRSAIDKREQKETPEEDKKTKINSIFNHDIKLRENSKRYSTKFTSCFLLDINSTSTNTYNVRFLNI